MNLFTARLQLVAATPATLAAALAGPQALAASLAAAVAPGWPPEFLDDPALEFTRARLLAHPEEAGWWMYFVLLPASGAEPRQLIGSGGYKGPPVDGCAEIGYGIVPEQHRRGFASEAAFALIERAFAFADVDCVAAETLPGMTASLGVMRRCGMQPVAAADANVLRCGITRAAFDAIAARV